MPAADAFLKTTHTPAAQELPAILQKKKKKNITTITKVRHWTLC
jgi:hypothetical protein